MQDLKLRLDEVVLLDLNPPPRPANSLSLDEEESPESKIQRLISEHPVLIFTRSSCCMCHVMKKLLASIGVHPTVIELDDHEISAIPHPLDSFPSFPPQSPPATPSVFIQGACVGGLESLVALHLGGHLVPMLVEAGAIRSTSFIDL